jgi:ankyrin repeat protein
LGHENQKNVNALLRSDGIDVNLQTSKGNTSLHMAAEKGYLEIVEALIGKNIVIDLENNEGQLASDLAGMGDHLEVLKLCQKGDT